MTATKSCYRLCLLTGFLSLALRCCACLPRVVSIPSNSHQVLLWCRSRLAGKTLLALFVALPHTRTNVRPPPAKDRVVSNRIRCAEFCWPLSLSFRKLCWRKKGDAIVFAGGFLVGGGKFPARQAFIATIRVLFAPARSAGRMPCGRAFASIRPQAVKRALCDWINRRAALRPHERTLFMADHCRQPQYVRHSPLGRRVF